MRILICTVLMAFPVQAAEPVKPDVICNDKGWCAIRQDTLKTLIEGAQRLTEHTAQLRLLCGWDK